MSQKVIRTGNSVAVTLPSEFVKDLGIHVGDLVRVRIEKDKGKIIFSFTGVKQLPLDEKFLQKSKR
ncbi:MAG: AbrB/MazE/SpoVT family DNA-binding domain-containing protein [bacterium]|nr:AbrB/MazE/SpoVT family DNA-binding domain-containing protein [bacterium]